MAIADLISVSCLRGILPYWHFGIDIGDGTVVHLATEGTSEAMSVQRIPVESFSNGKRVYIEAVKSPFLDSEVVERALQSVGQSGYHLAANNCEHFARYIKTGVARSHQVDRVGESVVRCVLAGIASTSYRNSIAATIASATRARWVVTASAIVPTLVGEATRYGAYNIARHCDMHHDKAHHTSRAVGLLATAVSGFAVGGPVGSACAVAIAVAVDR
jgi:hypothetical protein